MRRYFFSVFLSLGLLAASASADLFKVQPKICCFFKKMSVKYFTSTALHSADKFTYEQQILGLKTKRRVWDFTKIPALKALVWDCMWERFHLWVKKHPWTTQWLRLQNNVSCVFFCETKTIEIFENCWDKKLITSIHMWKGLSKVCFSPVVNTERNPRN